MEISSFFFSVTSVSRNLSWITTIKWGVKTLIANIAMFILQTDSTSKYCHQNMCLKWYQMMQAFRCRKQPWCVMAGMSTTSSSVVSPLFPHSLVHIYEIEHFHISNKLQFIISSKVDKIRNYSLFFWSQMRTQSMINAGL